MALQQRVELITWAALDNLQRPATGSTPNQTRRDVDGFPMVAERSLENGRIDLNGLSRLELTKAIVGLGFTERRATDAANRITIWRGMDPPGAGGLDLTVHGRTALWSLDDLNAIPELDGEIRDCLFRFGTVHAQGTFSGSAQAGNQNLSLVPDGTSAPVIKGGIIRIIATDETTGRHFRSIVLFRGFFRSTAGARDASASPWMLLEWLKPVDGINGSCPSTVGENRE